MGFQEQYHSSDGQVFEKILFALCQMHVLFFFPGMWCNSNSMWKWNAAKKKNKLHALNSHPVECDTDVGYFHVCHIFSVSAMGVFFVSVLSSHVSTEEKE